MTSLSAKRNAPYKPLPEDNYEPTNETLWKQVLELTRGERKVIRFQDKEYHAPNNGRGWKHWPSPKGVAWAVKQYNGLGGGWKSRKEDRKREATVRFAALGDTLEHVLTDLLSNWDLEKAKKIGEWFEKNFRTKSPKTPRGMKDLKDKAESLRWWLTAGPSSYANHPETVEREIGRLWTEIRPRLNDLVSGFTDEGGVVVPKELRVEGNTYINEVGLNESSFQKYVARLELIFKDLNGWHKKALTGGVTIILASPRNFRGTAGGKYKTSEDRLLVRTTPNILRRSGGYASFEYILTHEIGHRFERKNRLPTDFDKPEWWTTKYSYNEGESFAELFALSHFGLRGSWDQAVVEKFRGLMSGQGNSLKPELPEHLRKFQQGVDR
jgi:hypothetical protein